MISRRTYRPYGAVENLKQLCLNNVAGVDENAPHSNTSTVFFANNLVNNVDGSLSLRKPILMRTCFESGVKNAIPTGVAGVHVVTGVWDNVSGVKLLSAEQIALPYRLVLYDVSGTEVQRKISENTVLSTDILDLTNVSVVHTGTAVVLGNGMLNLMTTSIPGTVPGMDPGSDGSNPNVKLYDKALYDVESDATSLYMPRYVQVYYSEEYSTWVLRVHCADVNKYVFQDGTVRHDTDALLDNPYAVSDSYASSAAPKVIRAYVRSIPQATGIVPSNSTSTVQKNNTITPATSVTATTASFTQTEYTSGEYSTTFWQNNSRIITSNVIYDAGFFKVTESVEVSCTVTIAKGKGPQASSHLNSFNLEDCEIRYFVVLSDSVPKPKEALYTFKIPQRVYKVKVYRKDASGNKYTREVSLNVPELTRTVTGTEEFTLKPSFKRSVFYDNIYNTFPQDSNWLGLSPLAVFDIVKNYKDWEMLFTTASTKLDISLSYWEIEGAPDLSYVRVADLTKSTAKTRFRATTTISKGTLSTTIFKAFSNLPPADTSNVYCSWRYTSDGIVWHDAIPKDESKDNPTYAVEEPSYVPIDSVESSEKLPSLAFNYRKLTVNDSNDLVKDRVDCLVMSDAVNTVGDGILNATAVKFKMCTLDTDSATTDATAKVLATYGELVYQIPYDITTEFEQSMFGNAATGFKVYSGGRIFSYGAPFRSNILYTYSGELTTPLYNAITLNTTSTETVTSVIPWRDYIVTATPTAVYLSTKSEYGFFTKTVNTAVGVPTNDGRCCVPVLNGVMFKSGPKVYQMYPDVYSGDDTILNVTELSKSISSELDAFSDCKGAFAFCTSSEYVLMLPYENSTRCFRYDLSAKRWTSCTYPVHFVKHYINSIDDIVLYANNDNGHMCTYRFDATLPQGLPYGDAIGFDASEGLTSADVDTLLDTYYTNNTVSESIVPIGFELDTGQKSDTISTTKQFVESKLVFATEHGDDSFPMQLAVHVDGDPHIVTKDISTDASFWKDDGVSGVLNTTFNGLSPTSDSFNTLRQLVVRYSGKGKSVRHILTGESLCNFKLYETYIRYKLLNVKQ